MPYSTAVELFNYWLWRGIGWLAFNRIVVVGKERLPSGGPVLFVATHRNGALDAAAYTVAAPMALPMLSAQLQRLPLGRFLFRGIAVARAKDKARGIKADNIQAMDKCLTVLKLGRRLFIMPEGTSTLGHLHLPFNRGAAKIVGRAMAVGITPTIVPLAVHYEDPTQWQSRVEVLVGDSFQPQIGDETGIHRLIGSALEAVGANFSDAETQRMAEQLAYACVLDNDGSYSQSLKSFERQIAVDLADAALQLQILAKVKRLFLLQGLPLLPLGPWYLSFGCWLLLAPLVASFCIMNFPVLVAAYIAGKTLPDEANVIAFWRMAIGVPLGLLWAIMVSIGMWLMADFNWMVLYWVVSLAGIASWYRFRKLSVALGNAFFRPGAKTVLLNAYRNLWERMPHV